MNRLRINRMGVLSVAKIQALIGLVIGLLIGLIYGFFIIVYSLFGAGMIGGDAAVAIGGGGIVLGIAVVIFFPIFYGILGFIGGAIGAALYNVFARMIGGIEMETESLA